MKITPSHYTFWLERKLPTPRWADTVRMKRPLVSVHDLINAQVEPKPGQRSVEPGNTVNLLRMHRRRLPHENIVLFVRKLAAEGDNPQRRAYCKRWLRKAGAL